MLCHIDHDVDSVSAGAIMSRYAKMMKKKGAMTKKGKKETPAHNLERELLTDNGFQSPGIP
jgi:hypothetical protein